MHHPEGNVILFLGTSSAGKTKICNETYDHLHKNFRDKPIVRICQDESEDRGISAEERKHFPPTWSTEHILLFQEISKHTSKKKIVLGDLMLFENQKTHDITESFIAKLKTITNVFSVLVYCPLPQLIKNVDLRNSSDDELDQRSPSEVIGQYCEMYLSQDLQKENDSYKEIDVLKEYDILKAVKTLQKAQPTHDAVERYIQILRNLSNKVPLPVITHNIYDVVMKNKKENFDKEIILLLSRLKEKLI